MVFIQKEFSLFAWAPFCVLRRKTMKYSVEEILQYVNEDEVNFIQLVFCDIFGKPKNISIMPSELIRAFEYGIAIDASAVRGFGGEVHSDLFLCPEPDTLTALPRRPEYDHGVRMFCSVKYPNGEVFENDTRYILKKAIKYAEEQGLVFSFGAEMEFYLFRLDEYGKATKEPFDSASYMDIAPDDKCENVRREICLQLEQMGISPESSHHEEGPGQNEIDFRYSDALSAADNTIAFRNVVKTVAQKNGLVADFSPKPLDDFPGNGFHINISAKQTDTAQDPMTFVIAGILDKISDITAFLNPSEKSYKRLGFSKAPRYISWSAENRSQLIRIPAANGEYKRAELRSPDPSANPYLAFALLIYAGIYGVQNRIKLPEAVNMNLFTVNHTMLSSINSLPDTLKTATEITKKSDFVKQYLPELLIRAYCGKGENE